MSVRQSNGASASSFSYDGSRGKRGDDEGDGENDGQKNRSQRLLSSFANEVDITHCTQDEEHDSRRTDLVNGTLKKPY